MEKKSLQTERLVFFSDAVVAIAITLLALDIRIEPLKSGHLHFSDLLVEWKTFLAFTLSFLNIANFWRTHHSFFSYIDKMDERLLSNNIIWLFFIVLLPFSTTLVSGYFFDTTAIFVYSLNLFLIAVFQNNIWDYSCSSNLINTKAVSEETASRLRLFCNLDMLNALVAIGLSFVNPVLAFILLFTKLPTFLIVGLFHRKKFKDQRDALIAEKRNNFGRKHRKNLNSGSDANLPVDLPDDQQTNNSGTQPDQIN
ncbi:TMEM175 family protein [Fluviicola sp.]|uniref:TMEM175 family protein n=1 Tax=Fluviicola sp. TaxID=1917219 RepID=UPI0026135C6F|nr:TMEM175 family protein [Fluviicola sp.]